MQKLRIIKPQIQLSITSLGAKDRSRFSMITEKVGIAAVTTILVYSTAMFMNLGKIVWPDQMMKIEIVSAFFFLLILFWIHRKISNFINSKLVQFLKSWQKKGLELVLVIVTTSLLHVLNFLPLRIAYPSAVFDSADLRLSFLMAIGISLLFYFLVERERSKRLLQEKMLIYTRLQKENFEAQLQSIKNQINPHFLFNSLNVLGSLIRQDKSQASEFINRLSKVYHSILDHSQEHLVPLKKELELTEAYIYLLSTRFGNNLKFNIDIFESHNTLLLPPGSLQMLVENAVKHNGSTRKKPLVIEIYSKKNHLIVKNNLQPRLENVTSTKTGLTNIKRRYDYLSDKQVEIQMTENEFIAKLPLLKVENYENNNY